MVVNEVLKAIQNRNYYIYVDYIINCSTSLDEHTQNLKQVFRKLPKIKLKIQINKCGFLQKEVKLSLVLPWHKSLVLFIKSNLNEINVI